MKRIIVSGPSAGGFGRDWATILKVAEKIINNKPDYSGLVWGYSDDKIAIVTDDAATSIPTPKVGSYTLENITLIC